MRVETFPFLLVLIFTSTVSVRLELSMASRDNPTAPDFSFKKVDATSDTGQGVDILVKGRVYFSFSALRVSLQKPLLW